MNISSFLITIRNKKPNLITLKETIEKVYQESSYNRDYLTIWENTSTNKLKKIYKENDLIVAANTENITYFIFIKNYIDKDEITLEILLFSKNEDINYSINKIINHINTKLIKTTYFSVLSKESVYLFPFNKNTLDIWGEDYKIKANIKQREISKFEILIYTGLSILFLFSFLFWYFGGFTSEINSILISLFCGSLVALSVEILKSWVVSSVVAKFIPIEYYKYLITIDDLNNPLEIPISQPELKSPLNITDVSSVEKEETETKTTSPEEVSIVEVKTTEEPEIYKALDLLDKQKFIEAENIFKEFINKSTEDEVKKKKQQIIFHYFKFFNGGTDSLNKIQQIISEVNDNEVKGFGYKELGNCYKLSKNFNEAITNYKQAIKTFDNEEFIASVYINISECFVDQGNKEDAINVLLENINKFTSNEAKYIIYISISDYYKNINKIELSTLALIKALEIKPNHIDNLFKVAHSYSNFDYKDTKIHTIMSLLYYQTSLIFNSKNFASLNNIGIIYDELKLPLSANNSLLKAMELNNDLSIGNYANNLVISGFEKEASNIIKEHQNDNEIHPRIIDAIRLLTSNKEYEKNEIEKFINLAKKNKTYFIKFADALFSILPKNDFGQDWMFDNEFKIEELKHENSKISFKWTENNYETILNVEICNSLIFGKLTKKYISTYNYFSPKNFITFGILSSDLNTIELFIFEQTDISEKKLTSLKLLN